MNVAWVEHAAQIFLSEARSACMSDSLYWIKSVQLFCYAALAGKVVLGSAAALPNHHYI